MLLLGAHRISGLWEGKCFYRVKSSKTGFRQIEKRSKTKCALHLFKLCKIEISFTFWKIDKSYCRNPKFKSSNQSSILLWSVKLTTLKILIKQSHIIVLDLRSFVLLSEIISKICFNFVHTPRTSLAFDTLQLYTRESLKWIITGP